MFRGFVGFVAFVVGRHAAAKAQAVRVLDWEEVADRVFERLALPVEVDVLDVRERYAGCAPQLVSSPDAGRRPAHRLSAQTVLPDEGELGGEGLVLAVLIGVDLLAHGVGEQPVTALALPARTKFHGHALPRTHCWPRWVCQPRLSHEICTARCVGEPRSCTAILKMTVQPCQGSE